MSFMHLLNWLSQLIFEFMVEPNSGERDDNIIIFLLTIGIGNMQNQGRHYWYLIYPVENTCFPVPYRPITSPAQRISPRFACSPVSKLESYLNSQLKVFLKRSLLLHIELDYKNGCCYGYYRPNAQRGL
jgi:hypothetical protein